MENTKNFLMPKRYYPDGSKRHPNQIPEPGQQLADLYPEVASEFIKAVNPKEEGLGPWDYKPNQGKRAWFKCNACGYVWDSIIKNRTKPNKGCPNCKKAWSTSYQEQYIKNVLQCVFPDLQEQVRIPETRMSFDMYIPSEKLIIEYGSSWQHAEDRSSDAFKRELCKNTGIDILFIIQDKDVSARRQGQFFDGAIRIANRNKVDQKRFIDPILNIICKFYGKEYELTMVDRNLCSRKALENQKHVR